MKRVVITGIGVVSPIGLTRAAFEQSLRQGASGITRLTVPGCQELRFVNAAQVPGFQPEVHIALKESDMLDRFAQFAVVAAREASVQSGIQWTDDLRENAAVVTGSCVGGKNTEDRGFHEVYKLGKPRVHPMTIPMSMVNAGASAISLDLGITGPVFTISTACASSAHAIGQALLMLRSGLCEVAVAGGSEAPLSFGILKAWEAMRVVSPDVCRPFSRNRAGMILGEGAAMFVLENLEHAVARGARPIAEIVGFGMSGDAHHITQPSAEGAARAISRALKDAALSPEQIGYVNAHGTGTSVNDVTETRAIHLAFGTHAQRLAVSSTKSMHGHTLGAAGAMEGAATALGLAGHFLPPTINLTEPDPECDLDYIREGARNMSTEYAISSSFAFGGLNAVLAFRALP